MPMYFFNLKTTNANIRDPYGTELHDEEAAWELARQTACELMKRRESQTRSWRIDVRNSDGLQCFELLFATVDETIMVLEPELRGLIENLHRKQASLTDAIAAVQLSLLQIQGTIARSKGKPYLAALDGVAVAETGARYGRDGDVMMAKAERPASSDGGEHAFERHSL
jgi:hypothetical protein